MPCPSDELWHMDSCARSRCFIAQKSSIATGATPFSGGHGPWQREQCQTVHPVKVLCNILANHTGSPWRRDGCTSGTEESTHMSTSKTTYSWIPYLLF
jgi:hypothetical protein